jgi:hypothetical protein
MTAKAKVWCILTQDGLNRVMRPEDQQKLKDAEDAGHGGHRPQDHRL